MNIIIINYYAPTDDKSKNIKNAFYEELDRICDALSTEKPKIILRDFNVKIGATKEYKSITEKDSLRNVTNGDRNKLVIFETSRNVRISITMFLQKNIYKQTWISSRGEVRNQVDRVMVDYQIRLSLRRSKHLGNQCTLWSFPSQKSRLKLENW